MHSLAKSSKTPLVGGRRRWLAVTANATATSTPHRTAPVRARTAAVGVDLGKRQFTSPAPLSAVHSSGPTPTPIPKKPLFNKILIANRGEIACRIIRTARRLGIKTVAVFSEADRHSLHVKLADEAHLLGPAPSSDSYLRYDKIIDICLRTGAQAVHPGYGFLSENANFARELDKNGIVFIGPGVEAIESMGSKSESKEIMLAAGVPCVPGWHPSSSSATATDEQDADFLQAEANKIGYPVLIKCVSGGGGKGMKIVEKEDDFKDLLQSAKREGMKSFADDRVLLEKYLKTPRHIEVQIFSSSAPHSQHLSLFCRDCSIQRRHQKIIEEAPAPLLSDELREDLYDKARKAALAVSYRGAGTVEFIMDTETGKFYFMEMNTRLQVEHPVTEAITGVDLVEWQLEVAAGNAIPLEQHQIKLNGHAFECRIYAENPNNNFLPDTGVLLHVQPPLESDSVRMETGFGSGDEISVYYDPLIAKLIVHGSDRTEALRKLRKALDEYQVVGPHTNIEFLKRLTENQAFIDAEVETGFIPKHYDELFAPQPAPTAATLAQAGLFKSLQDVREYLPKGSASSDPWRSPLLAGFRTGGLGNYRHRVVLGEKGGDGEASVSVGGPIGSSEGGLYVEVVDFEGAKQAFRTTNPSTTFGPTSTTLSTLLGEQISLMDIVSEASKEVGGESTLHLFENGKGWKGQVVVKEEEWRKALAGATTVAVGSARAPMPSRIVQVYVKVGEEVTAGAPLVMVEAMKTEHVLRAPKDGKVSKIMAAQGELVPEGKVLVEFEEEESGEAK